MPDERDAIRARVDLADLVSERVRLTKIGKKLKGLCPFHTEKTPSFYVDSELQLFHCFGCKKGGDIFDWVMVTENLDFRAALETLAQRAGVELPKKGPRASTEDTDRKLSLMETALTYFRLRFKESDQAREYAGNRGLDEDTLERWQIGYAPDNDQGLATHLKQAGHKLQEAHELSLVHGSQGAGYGDFFRSRLMFPIRDDQGRLIAFSGRAMGPVEPKYINSKDTPLFRKSDTLFGLHLAREGMKQTREAILVEGQMDAIACHQAGLTNAVAPLGTSLTEGHAQRLRRLCDRVVLVYDADEAGRAAALRSASILEAARVECLAILLDAGDDPDAILRRDGTEALRKVTSQRLTPLRFAVESLNRQFDASPGIADHAYWRQVKEALAQATDQEEANSLAIELAAMHPNAKVDPKHAAGALLREIGEMRKAVKKGRKPEPSAKPPVAGGEPIALPTSSERTLLRAAISGTLRDRVWPLLSDPDLIVSSAGRSMADAFLAAGSEPDMVGSLPAGVRSALVALEPPPDPYRGTPPDLSVDEVDEAIGRLEAEKQRRKMRSKWKESPDLETAVEFFKSRTES